jgi:glycosyltransferase involved in cell wall biosynthesis
VISAVVNTWNEENNIENCLSCLKWCDEIVVVDMHSSDKTRDIARRFTDKVFLHPLTYHVEPARQFAVEQTRGEWILVLDADEMITPFLAGELKKLSTSADIDIVSIPTKTFMFGRWINHSGWWPDYHFRFFRRDCVKFTGVIHSQIKPVGRIYQFDAKEEFAIRHCNYVDASHFIEKLNRYTTVEAHHLFDTDVSPGFWKMWSALVREFLARYVKQSGFRNGMDGFFLAASMVFYRLATFFKLHEAQEYKKSGNNSKDRYNVLVRDTLQKWTEKSLRGN